MAACAEQTRRAATPIPAKWRGTWSGTPRRCAAIAISTAASLLHSWPGCLAAGPPAEISGRSHPRGEGFGDLFHAALPVVARVQRPHGRGLVDMDHRVELT